MNERPLLLIDSYAQIYRGFYAVRALTNAAGAPSNAVFAFSKFISRLTKDNQEADGAFIFDIGRPAHRMALAPDYKANRPPMPEELRAQLPAIRELITAFGWPIIEFDGYEADDIIASIAIAERARRKVVIVSADKDLCQLIGINVEMLVPDKEGGLARRGTAEVLEKFGVPPEHIADLLALTGDSSDNIQGIDGVGPKTAAALVNEFGSLQDIIANAAKIKKDALRAKVEAAKELLERNLKLVKLGDICPPGVSWTPDKFKLSAPQVDRILKTAGEYNLKSLQKDFAPASEAKSQAPVEPTRPEPEQLTLF